MGMMEAFRRHRHQFTHRFMDIFKEIDSDGLGRITLREFIALMDEDSVKDYFASLELQVHDALCLFDMFEDASQAGVEVDEFVMGCLRLKGTARSSDMIRLMHDQARLSEQVNRILLHLKVEGFSHLPVHQGVFMEKALKDISKTKDLSGKNKDFSGPVT